MPLAFVNGIEMYYERFGLVGDLPILLISGTGNDLRADPRRAEHPLILAGFDVLMFDQRGLGQTEKPDQQYSMADYADDAAGLLKHVGWTQANIIGISFGGMVAQHLAIRHPTLVTSLVLACTSSGGDGGSSFDLLAVADLPEDERIRISVKVMDRRNDLSTSPPTWAPGFELLARGSAASRKLQADDPRGAMGARRQLEARSNHNTYAHLPSVACPALVVGGHYDGQAPKENLQRLADQIGSDSRTTPAHLEFFEGGHGFLLQDPTAWPFIINWLNEHLIAV